MYSPNSSFQNDPNYESAVQDIEQEKKMVAALKRLSIGNLMQYDPDLPPGSMDDVDPFATSTYLQAGGGEFYDEDLIPQQSRHVHPSSASTSATASKSPSKSPSSSTSPQRQENLKEMSPVKSNTSSPIRSPPSHLHAPPLSKSKSPSPTKRHSLAMDNDSILTTDDEFFDAAEDQVYDASNTIWVPAEMHPQVNPDSFKTLIKHQVEEIIDRNIKRRSTISRRSTLSRQSSITEREEEPSTVIRVPKSVQQEPSQSDQDQQQQQQQQQISGTPSLKSSKSSSPPKDTPKDTPKRESWYIKQKRFSNPSLRELTTELQQLSKMAGMDKSDAVTIARTLSSNSLGYTDVEKLAFDELNHSPPHGDTNGTSSSTLHLQQRLQQQFNQSWDEDEPVEDEDESEEIYSNTLPVQGVPHDFALRRSRRTDYRKKDFEHSSLPDISPLSGKHANQHNSQFQQRGYKTRDSQLLFSYKKLNDESQQQQSQPIRHASKSPSPHDSILGNSFSTSSAPGSPYVTTPQISNLENRPAHKSKELPKSPRSDPYLSNRYGPGGSNQKHQASHKQKQTIHQSDIPLGGQYQYRSRQQYPQQHQNRNEKVLPGLPQQYRQQYVSSSQGNHRNQSPFQQDNLRTEQLQGYESRSLQRNENHHLPSQSRTKPNGSHHHARPEKKLVSASNTNINDFMIDTPTKQSRNHHRSYKRAESPRHSSQRPQPDVPMLFPSSKDRKSIRVQQQQQQQQLPQQQQHRLRQNSRPDATVPARSKQLHQNLDLLRSEINEFKESLNKSHDSDKKLSVCEADTSRMQQQYPQQCSSQSKEYQQYQHNAHKLVPHQKQPQQKQRSQLPKNMPDSDISFDYSLQDLSTDDPLGIEQDALRELGRKKEGNHGEGDNFETNVVGEEQLSSSGQKTPSDEESLKLSTPERELPLEQSTPEQELPLKQSTPENDIVNVNANDDLFANIPDVEVDDFSDLEDEPIFDTPETIEKTGNFIDGQPPLNKFQLSSDQSSSANDYSEGGDAEPVAKLNEPFLKNYHQSDMESSSRVKTSSKPTKVNTKLFNKSNIQIIDSDNYEEKMGFKKKSGSDDGQGGGKTLRVKKSFGSILSGGGNLAPPNSNEHDFDDDKKLKKKKSWNWLRERSSSLSSVESSQHQSASSISAANGKTPNQGRSFSNPEPRATIGNKGSSSNSTARKSSLEHEDVGSVQSDKENVLSKLFKKKSKANLSSSSVSSLHSEDSKNSGVTVNYHDNEQKNVKKKTSGLFKKRSKAKLVDHNRERSPSLSKQDHLVGSFLSKKSIEIVSPQSSKHEEVGDGDDDEMERQVKLLHELNPQQLQMVRGEDEKGFGNSDDNEGDHDDDAFASFNDTVAVSTTGEEEHDINDKAKLTSIDINNLDSNDNAAKSGLKSKKSTVKKHKRYRHRKKEKENNEVEGIKSRDDATTTARQNESAVVEVTAIKDETQQQAPEEEPQPSITIDQDTNDDSAAAATATDGEEDNTTKEQVQQLQKIDIQEKLKKSIKRTSKANQPIEFTDSAFGFPLPPPSQSTIVMLDYRFPVHVERAIYRLSHLKLANPKRSLREQVLLSNFMYAYLNLVDHTLHMEQQMGGGTGEEEEEEEEGEEQEDGGGSGEEERVRGDDEDESMVDREQQGKAQEENEEEEETALDHFGTDGGVDVDFGDDVVIDDYDVGFSSQSHYNHSGHDDDDDDMEEELLHNEETIRITA
ncbi:ZDS1 [Candida margitis]|uniref:ZDS1 n=1 Tax=Candida margitis TaxID=1775924 RepID=UPI002225EF41|nr:ZDS1 [Candida margitis]KAI5964925.1 ZDS1 [Candida margitis]